MILASYDSHEVHHHPLKRSQVHSCSEACVFGVCLDACDDVWWWFYIPASDLKCLEIPIWSHSFFSLWCNKFLHLSRARQEKRKEGKRRGECLLFLTKLYSSSSSYSFRMCLCSKSKQQQRQQQQRSYAVVTAVGCLVCCCFASFLKGNIHPSHPKVSIIHKPFFDPSCTSIIHVLGSNAFLWGMKQPSSSLSRASSCPHSITKGVIIHESLAPSSSR